MKEVRHGNNGNARVQRRRAAAEGGVGAVRAAPLALRRQAEEGAAAAAAAVEASGVICEPSWSAADRAHASAGHARSCATSTSRNWWPIERRPCWCCATSLTCTDSISRRWTRATFPRLCSKS